MSGRPYVSSEVGWLSQREVVWHRDLALQPADPLPLYHQLRERLRWTAHRSAPGTPLPSEKEIMSICGVSRATVRRAVADLVNESLLVPKQGRGTFTAPQRIEAELGGPLKGFSEVMRQAGHAPQTQVISAGLVSANDDLVARLGLEPGDGVFELERLRMIGDEPCMLERCYLSAALFAGILECDLTGSLYELMRSRYGVFPTAGTESIIAVNADNRLARLLHVPVAAALLATARSTFADRQPIEYTLRQARGDLCSFYVNIRDGGSVLGSQSAVDPLLLQAN